MLFRRLRYPFNEDQCFNKNKWKYYRARRYTMIKDIIESNILMGLDKKEIKGLLEDECNCTQSKLWSYYTGKPNGFHPFFNTNIYLYFNTNQRVFLVSRKRNLTNV